MPAKRQPRQPVKRQRRAGSTAELGEGKKISKTVIQQLQKCKTPFNLDDLQTLAELSGLDAWKPTRQ